MRKDDSDHDSPQADNTARVLLHPALFRPSLNGSRASGRSKRTNAEGAPLVHRHLAHGDVWFLDGEELFNGCIAEIQLAAPAVWLQTRIEGLPELPLACFHLADGTTIRIALAAGSRARWPVGGVDRSLCSQVLEQPTVEETGVGPPNQTTATTPK